MMPVAVLRELLKTGHVPASALGASGRESLTALFDAGALVIERVGNGRAVVVRIREPVESFADRHFPSGLVGGAVRTCEGTPRAAGVATVRDAKRARRGAVVPVLIRAFRPVKCLRRMVDSEETNLDLLTLTRAAGVAAITIESGVVWSLSGRIGVVENLEVFYNVERIDPDLDAAIYAGGRLSEHVVRWLAGEGMDHASLEHFGDYDPVGLAEYLRLRAACGDRVRLHIPTDLSARIRRYGKSSLLTGRNAGVLATLRTSRDGTVREVVRLMDETGCGLEQEALLLGPHRE